MRLPLIFTARLIDAAHIVAELFELHHPDTLGLDWRTFGERLIKSDQIVSGDSGYHVRVRMTKRTVLLLDEASPSRKREAQDGLNRAFLGEDGEWHYNDRASRLLGAAMRYKRQRGSWPTATMLQEVGQL